MGAFRDGEEPFRSSLLARRLLEGAGEQVVGRLLGQETVVLDDFKDYAMPLVELQRLLDWYPVGRGQGRERADDGQEVRPDLEHQPDDWYLRADPHRTVRRRISDFAERFGRLIECQAGWEASSRLPGGRGWGNTSEPNPATPGKMS